MLVLKKASSYLTEQAKTYGKRAGLPAIIGVILFVAGLFLDKSYLILSIGLLFLSISAYFSKKSENYEKGASGETRVETAVMDLNDSFYLINDIRLTNTSGNIDHVVLGPTGIFAIETKNFEGEIRCEGDLWVRKKDALHDEWAIQSPSKQVKKNALELKRIVSDILPKKRIWIDAVIVMVNPKVTLTLNEPTVQVLRVEHLGNYIKNKKALETFSEAELKQIGNALAN